MTPAQPTNRTTAVIGLSAAFLLALCPAGCETSENLIVNPGNCWVYSRDSGRLTALDADGELNVIVEDPGEAAALAADPVNGEIWLADAAASRLVKYDTDGVLERIVSGFDQPADMVVDPDSQNLYVIDSGAEALSALDENGNGLWTLALDYFPHQLGLAGQENARRLIIEGREVLYCYDTAQGELLWTHTLADEGRYHLDAEPDSAGFWLSDGAVLRRYELADASVTVEIAGLERPTVISATDGGCWVYDDAAGDLHLYDDAGARLATVADLPGEPLLGAVPDRVWVAVETADLVALYDENGDEETRTTSVIGPAVIGAVR
jgi:outer membrane protein assembly factor BamB